MSETLGPWDESWGPWLTPADCIGPVLIYQGMWYTSPVHAKGKVGDGDAETATSNSRRPPTHQHRLDQDGQQALPGDR